MRSTDYDISIGEQRDDPGSLPLCEGISDCPDCEYLATTADGEGHPVNWYLHTKDEDEIESEERESSRDERVMNAHVLAKNEAHGMHLSARSVRSQLGFDEELVNQGITLVEELLSQIEVEGGTPGEGMFLSLAREIAELFLTGYPHPIMLEGPPGTGKTQLMQEVARIMEADIMISNPTSWDQTNVQGIGWVQQNGGEPKAQWIPYADMEQLLSSEKRLLWGLDDTGHAAPFVQAALQQAMFPPRHLGPHPLPDCVHILGTTNREQDDVGASVIGTITDRCKVIPFTGAEPPEWIDWATAKGLPDSIAYMVAGQDDPFHDMSRRQYDVLGESVKRIGMTKHTMVTLPSGMATTFRHAKTIAEQVKEGKIEFFGNAPMEMMANIAAKVLRRTKSRRDEGTFLAKALSEQGSDEIREL